MNSALPLLEEIFDEIPGIRKFFWTSCILQDKSTNGDCSNFLIGKIRRSLKFLSFRTIKLLIKKLRGSYIINLVREELFRRKKENSLLKFVAKYPKERWDFDLVFIRIQFDLDFIGAIWQKGLKDLNWDLISKKFTFNSDKLLVWAHLPLNWTILSTRSELTFEIVNLLKEKPWDWFEVSGLVENWDQLFYWIDKNLNFNRIFFPDPPYEKILRNKEKDWAWYHIFKTQETIKTYLSREPEILANLLSNNRFIPEELLERYFKLEEIKWENFSLVPDEFVEKNPHFNWRSYINNNILSDKIILTLIKTENVQYLYWNLFKKENGIRFFDWFDLTEELVDTLFSLSPDITVSLIEKFQNNPKIFEILSQNKHFKQEFFLAYPNAPWTLALITQKIDLKFIEKYPDLEWPTSVFHKEGMTAEILRSLNPKIWADRYRINLYRNGCYDLVWDWILENPALFSFEKFLPPHDLLRPLKDFLDWKWISNYIVMSAEFFLTNLDLPWNFNILLTRKIISLEAVKLSGKWSYQDLVFSDYVSFDEINLDLIDLPEFMKSYYFYSEFLLNEKITTVTNELVKSDVLDAEFFKLGFDCMFYQEWHWEYFLENGLNLNMSLDSFALNNYSTNKQDYIKNIDYLLNLIDN